jgi:hypothetical protein
MNITELSEVTCRKWHEKFRHYLPTEGWSEPLCERVQMDEAFFRDNTVIAAKDVTAKRVVLRVIPRPQVQKQHIAQFVVRHVAPGSDLLTDGGGVYSGIGKLWPVTHYRDIHSKFEFAQTSEIEGVFGNLRTYIRRKYHHVTCSKLADVVAEFEATFNHPELFKSPNKYLEKALFLVPTC